MNHPDEEVAAAAADPNAGGLSPRELAIEAAKRLKAISSCEQVLDSVRVMQELYGRDGVGLDRDYKACLDYLLSLHQPDPGPIEYRPATDRDIGRLARFRDYEGEDWRYGRLVHHDGEFFGCEGLHCEGAEEFFSVCEVEHLKGGAE